MPGIMKERVDTEKVHRVQQMALIVGIIGGMTIGSVVMVSFGFFAEGKDALYTPEATVGARIGVTIPAVMVMAVVSGIACRGFAAVISGRRVRVLLSIPVGAVLGGIVGGLIGAAGWMVTIGIAQPFGIIDTGETVWIFNIALSFVAGGFWGALMGIIPGAIAGPVIALVSRGHIHKAPQSST